jgi:DNA ligase D-like protein (predicted 3'-phosphoesterase)
MSLREYRRKRDPTKTPEPHEGARKRSKGDPIFVIQKHDATALHYDFRLEVDGVLKSWAVPKGPSLNPADKRLAMPTEDHPMAYATFEGVIPEGEYGAGPVIVWDRGTFRNLRDESMREGLRKGHVTFWLDGEKLEGGFSLRRFRGSARAQWLLVKRDDEFADRETDIVGSRPESVRSGRTIEELAS